MKLGLWLKDHALGFLVAAVFMSGWLYAVKSSWQNGQQIEVQKEQLNEIHQDIVEFKKSFIGFLLDKNTNKSDIVKSLVSDTQTLQGINRFQAGQFDAAFAMWIPSAQKGNRDAALAIIAANNTLRSQASDTSLPEEERKRAQAALANVPDVNFYENSIKGKAQY